MQKYNKKYIVMCYKACIDIYYHENIFLTNICHVLKSSNGFLLF